MTSGSSGSADGRGLELTARDLGATAAIVLITIGFVLGSTWGVRHAHPEEECARLLDRFVAFRILAADPQANPYTIESRQAAARESLSTADALASCSAKLTEESAACADRAESADELERCFL
ncbi:MAG: hypothetical protein JNK04_25395 [Myxococcales bacterium]|nr:hypothetical protein [Myxococcales bacterium]